MNNRTFAKPKNKNSASFSPIFAKKASDRTFTAEFTNAENNVPNSSAGHNFGNIQMKSGQSFKDSCPLAMFNPSRCPYGGACHTCAPTIQTKLKVGQPNDKYEQEADRVAEQVMWTPEDARSGGRIPDPNATERAVVTEQNQSTPLQRQCTECAEEELRRQPIEEEEEEEEFLQTKTALGQTPEVTPDVQANINSIKGSGHPLPESVQNYFEPRFGHDFSHVRVHTDSKAAESAQAVNAQAYTAGRNVVFGAGQYAPETAVGKKLLAHELTHVIQQRENTPHRAAKMIQRKKPGKLSKLTSCKDVVFYTELDLQWPISNRYFIDSKKVSDSKWESSLKKERKSKCSISVSKEIDVPKAPNPDVNVHLLYKRGTCCPCISGNLEWNGTVDGNRVRQSLNIGSCAGTACCSINKSFKIKLSVLGYKIAGTVKITGKTYSKKKG